MSILSTSPTNTRTFDAQIAAALGDFNAAVIVQQLHYWMQKEGVGTIINNVKYIYNTFIDWVNQQFPWLSVWQFRKAMSLLRSLGIVKVIRHKAKQWNQTNFYSLDYDVLAQFLNPKMATTTEISELCISSPQNNNNQQLEVSDSDISLYRTKNTHKKEQHSKVAASSFESKLSDESDPKQEKDSPVQVTLPSEENKQQLELNKQNMALLNKQWIKQE